MLYKIKRYSVKHPLLKNYIKFFWEIHAEKMQLNHLLIPQRNINLRFNLNDTPHYVCCNNTEYKSGDVFFSGMHDRNSNIRLKLNGTADMLGICFYPWGFYPFIKIPVAEFKNLFLNAGEAGLRQTEQISEKLKNASNAKERINILETELLLLLDNCKDIPSEFKKLFNSINREGSFLNIESFCKDNNISIRTLERMYNKYIGISAQAFNSLNRFQNSMNEILYYNTQKYSEIAYKNGYFDQMHFIKNFKHFTGNTPKNFVQNNDSLLQIGKFI